MCLARRQFRMDGHPGALEIRLAAGVMTDAAIPVVIEEEEHGEKDKRHVEDQ